MKKVLLIVLLVLLTLSVLISCDDEKVNSVKFRNSGVNEYVINRDGSSSANMYFEGQYVPITYSTPTITFSSEGMYVELAEASFYFYKDLSQTKITSFDDLLSCDSIWIVEKDESLEYSKVVE